MTNQKCITKKQKNLTLHFIFNILIFALKKLKYLSAHLNIIHNIAKSLLLIIDK